MRVLCNQTWKCSIATCSYCWIYGKDGVGSGFRAGHREYELSVRQWIDALYHLPGRGTIDFCGGEPTMKQGFPEIVNSLPKTYLWAVTTNLARDSNVEVLSEVNNRQCAVVNCSYHKEVPFDDWLSRLRWLGNLDRFPISVTIVKNPYVDYTKEIEKLRSLKNLPHSVRFMNTPDYQNPQDSNGPIDEKSWSGNPAKSCSAGLDHILIDVNGDVYRCLTAFRSNRRGEFRIGNLLQPSSVRLSHGPCDLNCDPLEVKCWDITRK